MTAPLPNSPQAEQAVLGAVILDARRAFPEVADVLDPEDFYSPIHRAIYSAGQDLNRDGKPIDSLTLAEQMRANDTLHMLRAVGGEGYFAELTSAVVTVDNVRHYATIVSELARMRRAVEVLERGALAARRGDYGDPSEFLDEIEAALYAAKRQRGDNAAEPVGAVLRRTIKAIEKRYESRQVVTGVPSGYVRLDAMTSGFQPGDLVIVAARPSMGKTAFSMGLAVHAAIDCGIPALVFSLEMSKESLVERAAAAEGGIDSTRLRSGLLEQRDWINLTKAGARLAPAPLIIDDSSAPTLQQIRARARRWRSSPEHGGRRGADGNLGLGLILVDYMQLVGSPSSGSRESNREREVAEISRGLKALAKDLRVPVIALSQLNRAVEGRADKRPGLGDLRESGAIEQDADVVAFLYRDEVYNKETTDKGVAEVIIGKQRNGPVGTVRLRFDAPRSRFSETEGLYAV